jgi:hypothetical protein
MALTGGTNYPVASYRLGLPMPDMSTVTITVGGTALDPNDVTYLGAYVLTFVSAWGEESAMSDLSSQVFQFKNGQTMTIGNIPVPPAGNWNIPLKRIYRSNTGSSGGAQYQLVAEIPSAQTTFADSKKNEELGAVCVTAGWYAPPDDGFGLTLGANGNAIMLSGRTIHACEPYFLYAWPESYQNTVGSDLVGAGAFGQSFAILTKSYPYILSGVDPAGYTLTQLPDEQACVSKRSIVSMGGGVIYASPDGLWFIDGSGAKSLTEKLLTKEQWQAYNPATMHAYEYDGRYLAFYDAGCLIFDFAREPFMERLDLICTAAHLDPLRDALYLAQGSNINKFDAGAALNYSWRSAEYRWPRDTSFGYAKVDAENYPVTFRLYGDVQQANGRRLQELIHTQEVQSPRPFRLPAQPAMSHQYQLEGNVTVKGVHIAVGGGEIQSL